MEKALIDHSYHNRAGRVYREYSMTLRLNTGDGDNFIVEAEDGFDFHAIFPGIEDEPPLIENEDEKTLFDL